LGEEGLRMRGLVFLVLIFSNCVLFQKSVKIKPIPFHYQEISKNFFNPKNDKPFPLTIQRGNNLYNSTTADGRFLFYATNKEGNFDIWFRDLNSSIVVPVTEHPSQELKPAISPDGTKLVFVSEQYDSEGDIVLLEMDPNEWVEGILKGKRFIDNDFQVLTNNDWENSNRQQKVIDTDPAWLPSGEQIVFSSDRFSPGTQNLILLDLSNDNVMTQLTVQGGTSPFVSKDGKQIYFLSYQDSTNGEIYRLDIESGKVEAITKNGFLNYSPSISSDARFLYYTSIRKDSNGNGVLDERDNSFIVRRELATGIEKFLSSGENSIFDTRYSDFNGGSILFSAAFYNSINIYFIPYTGSIPKQSNIIDQYNYALDYSKSNSEARYFLALDSVELFFDSDPLYPIYKARMDSKRIEFLNKQGSRSKAENIRKQMQSRPIETDSVSIAYSIAEDSKINLSTQIRDLNDLTKKINSLVNTKDYSQELAAILHLKAELQEKNKSGQDARKTLLDIQNLYPNYHLIRDIRNKSGQYEFLPESIVLPKYYIESLLAYENAIASDSKINSLMKLEIKDLLADWDKKVFQDKTFSEAIQQITKMEQNPENPQQSNIFKSYCIYLKAKALRSMRNLTESSALLDTIIPIPQNLELDPPGQKSIFEYPDFIKVYKNPALSYIHLTRYSNAQDSGNGTLALRNLRIFMEFYDPIISPELKEEEFSRLFLYWENKAIEYERIGDLRQAAVHYYFNNLGMSLAKSKNISVEKFYGNYAVYYQRKMLETIFRYGRELRQKEEAEFLNQLNILGEGKLDIIGNLSDTVSLIDKVPIPFLDRLKLLGDFRDLQNKDVLHENATSLADLYFNFHLEKNRPYLNLAVVYGYAYYLINRAVLNENSLYQNNAMSQGKKQQILENFKKAEYELRWILFSDPTFPDAYQLLGWLYQYIDIIKTKQLEKDGITEEERYEALYAKHFPEKNFEENVELYSQILEFLGKDYKNKKVLSDLNLNLGNNYFLLSIYPKSNEASAKVEDYGKFILSRSQFENYQQEAIFHYNYGRSSLYRANYKKAIEQFQLALDIYEKKEYYQSLTAYSEANTKSNSKSFGEVKRKLAILNAMIGLCKMELGDHEGSIAHFQSAISQNRLNKEINELNLWNSLAIAYQKTGRFKESRGILDIADREYVEEKNLLSIFDISVTKIFWNFLLPDSVRVSGEGRFPGEFPLDFKRLLTKSIRINNLIQERDFLKAIELIKERDEFIRSENLKNWEMGILVTQQSYALLGQIYYDSKNYLEAYKSFEKMEIGYKKSQIQQGERIAILRKNYSSFSLVESEDDPTLAYDLLLNNIDQLKKDRISQTESCRKSLDANICNLRYAKGFKNYDILMGLNYYYLGEIDNFKNDQITAIQNWAKSYSFLKNPGHIDTRYYMLSKDIYTRRERIRNFINLARLQLRLGDSEEVVNSLKLAREYSYEFNLERESFQTELVELESQIRLSSYNKKSLPSINKKLNQVEAIWKSSKLLKYQVKDSTLNNFYDLRIGLSYLFNRPNTVTLIRDEYRFLRLHKEVITSSLEFNDLQLDILYKEQQQNLKNLMASKSNWENQALARENVKKIQTRVLSLERNLTRLESNLSRSFPQESFFLQGSNQQGYENLPKGAVSLRCHRFNDLVHIISRDSLRTDHKAYPLNQIEKYWKQNIESYKNSSSIFINPDNCSEIYKYPNNLNNSYFITSERMIQNVPQKEGQEWRYRTVFAEEDEKSTDRLQFSQEENLGPKLLNTDLLFSQDQESISLYPLFSYSDKNGLNIREIFTNKNEISAIALQSKEGSDALIDRLNDLHDLFYSNRPIHMIMTKQLDVNQMKNFERSDFKSNGFILGVLPDLLDSKSSIEKYYKKRSQAIEWESVKDYESAYDSYYIASTFLGDSQRDEILQSKLDLARIKRRLYTDYEPDFFYKNSLEEYKSDQDSINQIYKIFLRDCFSDRTIRNQRNVCESYYLKWNKNKQNKNSVEFYYKMFKGEIKNLDATLQLALAEKDDDDYMRFMRISDLYLENFLFEESRMFAEKAGKVASSSKETAYVDSRYLEIQYHRAFLEGKMDFSYQTIPSTTSYALGLGRNWDRFTEKVNSKTFKKLGDSDSIYDEYRKRLYNRWRDWEYGKEFESISLIPDELYEGGSVLYKMSQLNRSLYYYLLQESSKHQLDSESDSLIDLLIQQENEEGFKNRAFAYQLYYADQLIRNGEINSALNYIKDFEKKYDASQSFHPFLEKKYIYLVFKLSRFKDDIVFLKNTEKFLEPDVISLIQAFRESKREGPEDFDRILNTYLQNLSKTTAKFTPYQRNKLEDLLQYMAQVSMDFDSSEGFLDVVHFQDTLSAYNERSLGRKLLVKDLPKFKSISSQLMNEIPIGQNLHVVSDFLDKTFLVTVSKGKNNGRVLFPNRNEVRKSLRKYNTSALEGGEEARLRDILDDKYRNSIRMQKDNINYLYLSAYHLKAPILQKLDNQNYIVQNLGSLLQNSPVKKSSFTFMKSRVKKYTQSNFSELWYKDLKEIENWELKSIESSLGDEIALSQEELFINSNHELVFGGSAIFNLSRQKSDRKSVWVTSSNYLGRDFYLSNSLNHSLYFLDSIHKGPGIISIEDQSDFPNSFFLKNLLAPKSEKMELRYRLIEARDNLRIRYPFDKYWHGYRLYTSSFVLEDSK